MSVERSKNRLSKAVALGLAATFAAGGAASAAESERDNEFENALPQPRIEQFQSTSTTIFVDPLVVKVPALISEQVELENEEKTQEIEKKELEKDLDKNNLFSKKGLVFQYNGVNCVPASVQMMLNFAAINGTVPEDFDWKLNTSNKMQKELGDWIRGHDTLYKGGRGSDPNGWRNGLNKFSGSGNFKNPEKMLFVVQAYNSKRKALDKIKRVLLEDDMPVGVVGWNGRHAQVVHGVKMHGDEIEAVYMTSTWRPDNIVNQKIPTEQFLHGNYFKRLTFYNENDSFDDDPYTPGNRVSYKGWEDKVIIIVPNSKN